MKSFILVPALVLMSFAATCMAGSPSHGFTSNDIQATVDSVHRMGGGMVRINPGVYEITGPVRLYSNMTLTGAGPSTVFHKVGGFSTPMSADAMKGSDRITVKDPERFAPGTGIKIFDSKNNSAWKVSTAVVVKVEGNNTHPGPSSRTGLQLFQWRHCVERVLACLGF